MDQETARAAAALLLAAGRDGTPVDALPPALRPATKRDGHLIQAETQALAGQPLFGWKIAATSAAGQSHINVPGPIAGRILADMVLPDGALVALGSARMHLIEAEFAFRIGETLAPSDTPREVAEVLAAVEDLYLGIELPDCRFRDVPGAGEAQLIADNACAWRYVLGPRAPSLWRDTGLAGHRVTGRVSGPTAGEAEAEGVGANVLGHPLAALTWLANELSGLGLPLEAGQIVTTGTCIAPMPVEPGDTVTADFGSLGMVTCRIGE